MWFILHYDWFIYSILKEGFPLEKETKLPYFYTLLFQLLEENEAFIDSQILTIMKSKHKYINKVF